MRQILPVVEGRGEIDALPILVERVLQLLGKEDTVDVLEPISGNGKGEIVKSGGLERLVRLAVGKAPAAQVLVVIDADSDCAATLGPELQNRVDSLSIGEKSAVVVAVREYENWVVGDASALAQEPSFDQTITAPSDPEKVPDAKLWLRQHRGAGRAYRPTLHQALVTRLIDLEVVRQRCPSFDKFWREVERLATA